MGFDSLAVCASTVFDFPKKQPVIKAIAPDASNFIFNFLIIILINKDNQTKVLLIFVE